MKFRGTTAADFIPSKSILSLLSDMKASATDVEAKHCWSNNYEGKCNRCRSKTVEKTIP